MSSTLKTDWNNYYSQRSFFMAKATRAYLIQNINAVLKKHFKNTPIESITEFGGGNSILLPLFTSWKPKKYSVIDNNQLGLDLLNRRSIHIPWVHTQFEDILKMESVTPDSDVVISIGLIEHFNPREIAQIVQTHIDSAKEGGLIILTFPTPTWLYRTTRKGIEYFNLWRFPDETPLPVTDIIPLIKNQGIILSQKILWCQLLTQALLVIQKKERSNVCLISERD